MAGSSYRAEGATSAQFLPFLVDLPQIYFVICNKSALVTPSFYCLRYSEIKTEACSKSKRMTEKSIFTSRGDLYL